MCGHAQPLNIPTTCCNLQKAMANHCSILSRTIMDMYNASVIDNSMNRRILSKGNPHSVRRFMGNRWYLTIIKQLSKTKIPLK